MWKEDRAKTLVLDQTSSQVRPSVYACYLALKKQPQSDYTCIPKTP